MQKLGGIKSSVRKRSISSGDESFTAISRARLSDTRQIRRPQILADINRDQHAVQGLAMQTIRDCLNAEEEKYAAILAEFTEEDGRPPKPTAALRFFQASESRLRINSMIELARHALAARPEQFDADPYLLCCRNGVLDLRTGLLRPGRREDYLPRTVDVALAGKTEFYDWGPRHRLVDLAIRN